MSAKLYLTLKPGQITLLPVHGAVLLVAALACDQTHTPREESSSCSGAHNATFH